jgi:RNA polymerase sigma-70 factor (ECF subfamily)
MATQTALTPDNCIDDYALARIDYRVGRLVEAFHLDEHTAEDLRQDMIVELLEASSRYDPARSRRNTFITRVLDRHYLHLARGLANRQKHEALHPTPISVLEHFQPAGNDVRRGERSACERSELAMDLSELIDGLPAQLRRICEELQVFTPAEVAKRLRLHRSTVYRAMDDIRQHFVAAGLDGVA